MVKRFIAGAVCPQCRVADRLQVEVVGERTERLCVDCGFTDSIDNNPAPTPPASRLLRKDNKVAGEQPDSVARQVVRIVNPRKPDS